VEGLGFVVEWLVEAKPACALVDGKTIVSVKTGDDEVLELGV